MCCKFTVVVVVVGHRFRKEAVRSVHSLSPVQYSRMWDGLLRHKSTSAHTHNLIKYFCTHRTILMQSRISIFVLLWLIVLAC